MSGEMKVSFVVEITGCFAEKDTRCPHLQDRGCHSGCCAKAEGTPVQRYQIALDNRYKLTASCPMVKKQFEALI